MRIHLVSVDRGGSWIRLEAYDETGRLRRQLKTPTVALRDLPTFFRRVFKTWQAHPAVLRIGSKGVWAAAERTHLRRALASLARRVDVMSDVEAAWLAAFDSERESGIMVVSGTGSIALGKNKRGAWVRRGGLGPLLGDEGSAFWIGREWLKRSSSGRASASVLSILRPPAESVRRIAALATRVIAQAKKRQKTARAIVAEAQHQLARLAVETAQEMRASGRMAVSWSGSVLQNPWFREGFLKRLRRTERSARVRFTIVEPGPNAASALARSYFMDLHKRRS